MAETAVDGTLTADDIRRLRQKLLDERQAIVTRSRARAAEALGQEREVADEADMASAVNEQSFALRLADKDRKLLKLIEHALDKIERGDYGYCEGTGEPIRLSRLEARPWARYSVGYKEQLEHERALRVE